MTISPRSPRARSARRFNLKPLTLALLAAGVMHEPHAAATQPFAGLIPNTTRGWTGANNFGAGSISGNRATIRQTSPRAILNWDKFNLSAGEQLHFDQQGNRNWSALNRVWDVSPSVIDGSLTADGEVYVINRNGIIFGRNARVDTRGLVASALNITDVQFNAGVAANANTQAQFSGVRDDAIGDGNTPNDAAVRVLSGAQLGVRDSSRIMLIGPSVINSGSLSAPGGQVILAAGRQVYLAVSDDPSVRGLIVEVADSNFGVGDENTLEASTKDVPVDSRQGWAQNLGTITTARGNTSLVGLAVNQSGRISATTAVQLNGSIILKAASGATGDAALTPTTAAERMDGVYAHATTTGGAGGAGEVVFGAGSVTEVVADEETLDETALDSQAAQPSRVDVIGRHIALESGAAIVAPSGEVRLQATNNPSRGTEINGVASGGASPRIDIAAGAVIDVSGLQGVEVPADRNIVEVVLTSTELQDAPLLRDSVLYGATVYIDVTRGTTLFDASGYFDISRTVQERLVDGGAISLFSSGDVIVRDGATLAANAGTAVHQPGTLRTTYLLGEDGVPVSIENASPNKRYIKILDSENLFTPDRFNLSRDVALGIGAYNVEGYTEYGNGGALSITAPSAYLGGYFTAGTGLTAYQRANPAKGGSFTYIQPQRSEGETLLSGNTILGIVGALEEDEVPFGSAEALPQALRAATVVPTSLVTEGGFSDIKIDVRSDGLTPGGNFTLAEGAPLRLPAFGSLEVSARNLAINSSIRAPAGTVRLNSNDLDPTAAGETPSRLTIAPGVSIDVSGQWINDATDPAEQPLGPLAIDGGEIELSAVDVSLGAGSELAADGGAWQRRAGGSREPGSREAGVGGSIALQAQRLVDAGSQHAYALEQGGSLSLTSLAGDIEIGGAGAAAWAAGRPSFIAAVGQLGPAYADASAAQDALIAAAGDGAAREGVFGQLRQAGWSEAQIAGLSGALDALRDGALAGTLQLDGGRFSEGGFAHYDLATTATAPSTDTARIIAGAEVRVSQQNLLIGDATAFTASADRLLPLTTISRLPQYQRQGASLSISTELGDIVLEQGAAIRTDAGGGVSFSGNSIDIAGTIETPAGAITLTTKADSSQNSDGYNASRTLWLRDTAQLLARGADLGYVAGNGLRVGEVLSGGSVRLVAGEGSLVVANGALVDVSGSNGVRDYNEGSSGIVAQTVASTGGSIALSAAEALFVAGDLRAGGGSESVSGGSLSVDFSRTQSTVPIDGADFVPYPDVARTLTIGNQAVVLPDGFTYGGALPTLANGVGQISAATLEAGGFNNVSLRARGTTQTASRTRQDIGRIQLDAGLDLSIRGNLTLTAAQISANGGNARLVADSVTLAQPGAVNSSDALGTVPVEILQSGTGRLTVDAAQIDLAGHVVLQGFERVELRAGEEVRLRGGENSYVGADGESSSATDGSLTGSLSLLGDLAIAAPVVYPASLNRYTLESAGTISFSGSGGGVPLAAGGELIVKAQNIEQAGTLRAPFGLIALEAEQRLTLAPGSLTSVSAEGQTILLGDVSNTSAWTVTLDDSVRLPVILSANPQAGTSRAVPTGRVTLNGADVDLQAGARLDLSGNGDLRANEFVPGPLGSTDLRLSGGSYQAYAIIPGFTGNVAPDYYAGQADIAAGERIYLSGVAGLAEGYYTLLPARYATLPGAYLVSPVAGSANQSAAANAVQADGTLSVAGYRGNRDGSVRDAQWSGFSLTPASVLATHAQYDSYDASSFFAAQAAAADIVAPRLPGDAGSLLLSASNSLDLQATVALGAGAGRRGGEVAITAPRIAVVEGGERLEGYLNLDADQLAALNGESLTLGAIRTQADNVTTLDVRAREIRVQNSSANPLTGRDVLLAATERVELADGAAIVASGAALTDPTDTLVASGENGSDGALVRASTGALATVVREGAGAGDLVIGANTTLAAPALILDAAGSNTIGTGSAIQAERLAVSAQRVIVGDPGALDTGNSLVIGDALASSLGAASELRLQSYSSIDFVTDTDFGAGGALESLTLDTGALRNLGGAGTTVSVTASQIALRNSSAELPGEALEGGGGLVLRATANGENGGRIELGPNGVDGSGATREFAIQGFDTVSLQADRAIVARGTGATRVEQHAGGSTTLRAALVSTEPQADQRFRVLDADSGELSGRLILASNGASLAADDSLGGGRLAFEAGSVSQGGRIEVRSGQISLRASTGALTLGAGSLTSTAGADGAIFDYAYHLDGGRIALQADAGDIALAAGATVDVSARGDALAGSLSLAASQGTVSLGADLVGSSEAGKESGGRFGADVLSLAGLGELTRATTDFSGAWTLRQRQGDVALAAGERIAASEIRISADAGNLSVAGELDASGVQKGGRIGLYANRGGDQGGTLRIDDGAVLDASATGSGITASGTRGRGGDIELGVRNGQAAAEDGVLLHLAGGRIDLSAAPGSGALGGTLNLRTPLDSTVRDAALQIDTGAGGAPTAVSGAREVVVEAFRVFQSSTGTISSTSAYDDDLAASSGFVSSAIGALYARLDTLGLAQDSTHVRYGLEIVAPNSLTLSTTWDLRGANWRTPTTLARGGNEPGVLTLRSLGEDQTGNLTFSSSLTDGFAFIRSGTTSGSPFLPVVDDRASWGYRIVAGADAGAADPLAVVAGIGTVNIGRTTSSSNSNAVTVGTGTGRIDIAAGDDVVFNQSSSRLITVGRAVGRIAGEGTGASNSRWVYTLEEGGAINIGAQGTIRGGGGLQDVNNWLLRDSGERTVDYVDGVQVVTNYSSHWGIFLGENNTGSSTSYRGFRGDVGALGGGDVTIRAGERVDTLSAATASTGRVVSGTENVEQFGGGDLRVVAADDIRGGVFLASRGEALLQAGGSVGDGDRNGSVTPRGVVLALIDADARVRAVGSVDVERVYNPTLSQSFQVGGRDVVDSSSVSQNIYFNTYKADARLDLSAGYGDLTYGLNGGEDSGYNQSIRPTVGGTVLTPANLVFEAPHGDAAVFGAAPLPAYDGQFSVVAAGDVALAEVVISDVDPARVADYLSPVNPRPGNQVLIDTASAATATFNLNPSSGAGRAFHADTPVHAADELPVRVYAEHGDVSGLGGRSLVSPKPVIVRAGRDVRDFNLSAQNLDAADLTLVQAGRDIAFSSDNTFLTEAEIRVGGPGRLVLQAGRNIDLGISNGVQSVGALDNPALPADRGADITVLAGLGGGAPDYAAFAARYLGDDAPTDPELLQRAVLERFYAELAAVGAGYYTADSPHFGSYQGGYDAIGTLFPDAGYGGELNATYSQIKTLDGGNIQLAVPGGRVVVGVLNLPDTVVEAKGGAENVASVTGIVTLDGGDVLSYSDGDFLVNTSRVFTVAGGDIVVWSNHGSIDAGRGRRDATSAPPPQFSINAEGRLEANISGTVSGSGIGTLLTRPGQAPGDVVLVAPEGAIDAGEAGVRSSGNIILVADTVIAGVGGFDAGGTTTGAPAGADNSAAAGLAVAGSTAGGSKDADSASANVGSANRGGVDTTPKSLLTVEVVGLGDPSAGLPPTSAGPSPVTPAAGSAPSAPVDAAPATDGSGSPRRERERRGGA